MYHKSQKLGRNFASVESMAGNALFLILIAVMLFAALAYAVSNSLHNGGEGSTEGEKNKVNSANVQQFPSVIAQTITRMTISKTVTLDILSFAHAGSTTYGTFGSDPTHEIFNPQGGGVPYQMPEKGINDGSDWIFTGALEVEGIGSTVGDMTSSDLLALLPGVSLATCRNINSDGSINNLATPPTLTLAGESTAYTGTFSYADTISDASLASKNSGCYFSATLNKYVYYHVLAPR